MSIIKKLVNAIVYAFTDKPTEYVHIDTPKTLQDKRQVQFNNWYKVNGVYSGSYLPKDDQKLLKKGWIELDDTRKKLKSDERIVTVKTDYNKRYQRKSTGQIVESHPRQIDEEGNVLRNKHYHWENEDAKTNITRIVFGRDAENAEKYLLDAKDKDRYGHPCAKDSKPSHLAPLDKDYIWIEEKKGKEK